MKFECIFIVIVLGALALGKCPDDCKQPTFLYESFQCTAKCDSANHDCPSEYDCSVINQHSDMCYFNGNYYKNGETVKDDLTLENCMYCSCEIESDIHSFNCAYADCAPFAVSQGCRLKYQLGECCSKSQICSPYGCCLLDGNKFQEGEKFYRPKDNCTKCVCEKAASGDATVKCKKQYCLDLMQHQSKVKKMCAPFYYNVDYDCCPSNWICPEDNVTYIHEEHEIKGPKCIFGQKLLSPHDTFYAVGNMGKVKCECILPPFATCVLDTEKI